MIERGIRTRAGTLLATEEPELTFGFVGLVNQAGNDMAIFHIKVIVRPIDVCGDDTGKLTPILLMIGAVGGS